MVLITRYDPDQFLSVGVQCFRCGQVTWTPPLRDGDVIRRSAINLGVEGRFLLDKTVELGGVATTCSAEIARVVALTAPRKSNFKIELSHDWLDALVSRYDEVSAGSYSLQENAVRKNPHGIAIKHPFAWAVVRLRASIDQGILNGSDIASALALSYVKLFGSVVSIWEHHPRFMQISRNFGQPGSFFHTAYTMIAASYLYNAGNQITFALEDQAGVPNPDLYMKTVRGLAHVEVKAPSGLQYSPGVPFSKQAVEKVIDSVVKKSSRQINRMKPGLLVIASSLPYDVLSMYLRDATRSALSRKGRDHRSLVGIILISTRRLELRPSGREVELSQGYYVEGIQNAFYVGDFDMHEND